LRTNAIQYVVYDSYSASRTPYFNHRLMLLIHKYNGILVYADYQPATCRRQEGRGSNRAYLRGSPVMARKLASAFCVSLLLAWAGSVAASAADAPKAPIFYTVKPGDTLSTIA